MTVAITLKVNDGVVLAADSASTLVGRNPDGSTEVVNVYNNANKVFNLRKGLPLGTITWGHGSIGKASIETLLKDLRRRLSGQESEYRDWAIDSTTYTVEEVARRVRHFVFEEMYLPVFQDWPQKPELGLIVAGYSPSRAMVEEYEIVIGSSGCPEPAAVRTLDACGVSWRGQPEALTRLVLGFSPALGQILIDRFRVAPDQIEAAINSIKQDLQVSLVQDPMPIQDAIDLAVFLVETAVNFSRFLPGAATVGGPVEVAVITKHEGFKWVRRKYYYSRDINPEEASWTNSPPPIAAPRTLAP